MLAINQTRARLAPTQEPGLTVNLRVADLDEILARLETEDIEVEEERLTGRVANTDGFTI